MLAKISTITQRNSLKVVRTAGCMLLVIFSLGCADIPVPLPSASVTLIDNDEIVLIQVGKTRRADVRQQLGYPKHSFNDGSRWLYIARSRRAGIMQVCGNNGCTNKNYKRVITYLDIKFDSSAIVQSRELSTVKQGKCANSNICRDVYGRAFAYGSKAEDALAKRFATEPNRCAVYLYTAQANGPIFIQIDESESAYKFWSEAGYLRFNLDSGEHNITVAYQPEDSRRKPGKPSGGGRELSEAIKFACAVGSVYFMREHHSASNDFSFSMVADGEG